MTRTLEPTSAYLRHNESRQLRSKANKSLPKFLAEHPTFFCLMAICQFFLRGQCAFGDKCRNEHPRDAGGTQGSGSFGNQTWTATGRNPVTSKVTFSLETIKKDLTPGDDKPLWPLSSYGPGKAEPTLIQGLDDSPEELRFAAWQALKSGDPSQVEGYKAYEQNKISAAEGAHKNGSDNAQEAFQTAYRTATLAPSRLQTTTASQSTSHLGQPSAFGQPAFGQSLQSGSAFGQQSKPASAFGQSSSFGQAAQPSSAFGQSTFGQPAQTTNFSTFGQPAKPASAFGQSAFGQPAKPATAFGQTSFGQTTQPAAAFGQPAFGQPTKPSPFGQPAFGQTSTPAAAFGQPSAPAFGQPSQQPTSVFGQPSQSTQSAFGQPGNKSTSAFGQPAPPQSAFASGSGSGAFAPGSTAGGFVSGGFGAFANSGKPSAFGAPPAQSAFSAGGTGSAFDTGPSSKSAFGAGGVGTVSEAAPSATPSAFGAGGSAFGTGGTGSAFPSAAPGANATAVAFGRPNSSTGTPFSADPAAVGGRDSHPVGFAPSSSNSSSQTSPYDPAADPYAAVLPPNYVDMLPKAAREAFESKEFQWGHVPEWIPPPGMR